MNRWLLPSLTAAGALAAQAPDVASIQLPDRVVLTGTLATDIDGDGLEDLVLACRGPDAGRRELRVHLRRPEGPAFTNAPSLPPYAVEADVIAFTFADCTAAKGRELVLLTAERAVAVEFGEDGAPRYEPTLSHNLVWPTADPEFVLPLPDACVDFDGDGRDDLLLPQTWGTLVDLRSAPGTPRGGDFGRSATLLLPAWRSPFATQDRASASVRGGELRLGLQLGGAGDKDDRSSPLVRVNTRTPPCLVVDVDGNGRLDLAAVRNGRLFFAMQNGDGTVETRSEALPMPEDRLALFDPSFDVQLADVDGDRRLDLVLTTSASRDDEIEVRIDLFPTGADGTWQPKPASRLRMKALARQPLLVDADGDGGLDVIAVTVRTDALRSLTGSAPVALDAQCNIFRGAGGRFVTPALLIAPLRLPAKARRGGGVFVEVLAGADGTPGALLVLEGDVLQRRPLQRDGEQLRLGEPAWSLSIPSEARLELGRSGDVLGLSKNELMLVRTR